jgi:polyhydroxyalkanoate synthesis repressor PhaR
MGAQWPASRRAAAEREASPWGREVDMGGKEETVIKKYPNRRLYDTSTSSYVTLEDVKRLVEAKEPVKVVDAKTGEDLTRQTLMQILLESEAAGAPIFSSEMLAQMISFYGNAHSSSLGPVLDSSLKAFVAGADEMAKRASAMKAGSQKQMEALSANQSAWGELAKAQQRAVADMFGAWLGKPPAKD